MGAEARVCVGEREGGGLGVVLDNVGVNETNDLQENLETHGTMLSFLVAQQQHHDKDDDEEEPRSTQIMHYLYGTVEQWPRLTSQLITTATIKSLFHLMPPRSVLIQHGAMCFVQIDTFFSC